MGEWKILEAVSAILLSAFLLVLSACYGNGSPRTAGWLKLCFLFRSNMKWGATESALSFESLLGPFAVPIGEVFGKMCTLRE